ncbi:MAG: hypothetical protein BWX64_00298 [Acidobacteria bacterium ADurb.Bin051]|nr:MAG: hypothetical protein BWX64_00298 [Acidobacteria bacterium ADurb.Bin051]
MNTLRLVVVAVWALVVAVSWIWALRVLVSDWAGSLEALDRIVDAFRRDPAGGAR